MPLAVVAVVLGMAWQLYPALRMHYTQQREIARLEEQLVTLRARNAELTDEIDGLKTPEGVERAARQSLGYVKEGEEAYVVTDGGSAGTTATSAFAPTEQAASPDPWWRTLLDALFGVRS